MSATSSVTPALHAVTRFAADDAPLLAAAEAGAGTCLSKALVIRYSSLEAPVPQTLHDHVAG